MSRTPRPGSRLRARQLRPLLLLATYALAGCEGGLPTNPLAHLDDGVHADDSLIPSRGPAPPRVGDLRVIAASDSSLTLSWTAVADGRNRPAVYEMRYALTPIGWGWGSATVLRRGECAAPISAEAIGATVACEAVGLAAATSYDAQLVAYRETGSGRAYSELSNVATGVTEPAAEPPTAVSDLGVAATTASSVTLRFTEVSDGAGGAADYQVRRAATPIGWGWGSATTVYEGECASPIRGTTVGSLRTCTVTGLVEGRSYDFQMTSFREGEGGRIYSVSLSNVATAVVTSPTVTEPASVSDLAVAEVTESSVTLRFTEVSDGAGGAADYQVRRAATPIGWGWGSATTIYEGECASPIRGTTVGSVRTCTVTGLSSGTSYDFQLSSFRDDPDGRVYAASLSNVATGVTETRSATGAVASVEISPASPSIRTGSSLQLEAILRDAAGNLLTGPAVTWQSSNPLIASVSATGLVTGLVAGAVTISATTEGITGEAAVSVTLTSGGTLNANEPAGFSVVTERAFDDRVELGWIIRDDPTFTIVADASAPVSPASVGQAEFLAGYRGEGAPLVTEYSFAARGYTQVYVSFWVKLSNNWQGHNSGVNKIGFTWIDGDPQVVFNAHTVDSGPISPQVRIQGTEMPPDGAVNLNPNVRTDVRMQRGQWHHWEVVLRSNTGSNEDGEIHWWLDGIKAGEYRNIAFTNSSEGKSWHVVSWFPIWGGGPDLVSENMYMWMDHMYVSGSR